MSAQLLDGRIIARRLLGTVRERVALRVEGGLSRPGLAVILVGEDPASRIYVRNKRRACEETGIRSAAYDLPANVRQNALLDLIDTLNEDPEIHGILVQLPLPEHIDAEAIIERVLPTKDVDGFHPYNMGRLALGMAALRPCTPQGIMTLLSTTGEPLKGRDAVVVGHSLIVGRPMLLALLAADCTVTICHRETRDLAAKVRDAEILVVSVGKPGLIPGLWIREGAIVIDVGINRLPGGKIVGDVAFEAARKRAAWITPVPGGVGPMTVATLLANTVEAADRASGAL
uniref:Bifunctional protein FolD n=1 Tax=Candidatus Kentrum eta TaxID=2126337 RepID=A0A450UBV7_9GAMM|nr:MAG: methenyltetrahydrofolate cyclohydrolase /5,10-methylenetetrahydrofolate dehydrogenase (NADP+) [Candidatus Kentron sp. H]VFJ91308.1 MAG: methenyltetrahydrofolate cyclohydrolase /5,10-methylenetetrahydrofolate dehydrogenase (NADP+) [Candidatus Kentron sp. H]VFJ97826.1 MAG: methenyltetrahydrofolate cyclohydrolase /5,10-methylenetetrahydrofolate dehydrogenase (NADP+) [Candidatus Kentron sp. H]